MPNTTNNTRCYCGRVSGRDVSTCTKCKTVMFHYSVDIGTTLEELVREIQKLRAERDALRDVAKKLIEYDKSYPSTGNPELNAVVEMAERALGEEEAC